MAIIFYRRSGERISRAKVRAARIAYAASFERVGGRFDPTTQPSPRVAQAFRDMTEETFCDRSGAFTWRKVR